MALKNICVFFASEAAAGVANTRLREIWNRTDLGQVHKSSSRNVKMVTLFAWLCLMAWYRLYILGGIRN